MLKQLLDMNVESIRRRIAQGDCPIEPALSVETLENMVDQLAPKLALQGGAVRNCFGIPDQHNGWSISQGPDDRFYANMEISADTWEGLAELLDTKDTPR